MFKKGYKIIVIKDGQFDLKEFYLTPFKIPILCTFLLVPFILFYFILSSFNSSSISNQSTLVKSQLLEIDSLKSQNKMQSEKLMTYEMTIEDNIRQNKKTLDNLDKKLVINQTKSDQIVKTLFKTQALPREVRKVGSGGESSSKKSEKLDNSSLNKLYDQSKLLSHEINNIQKKINLENIYLNNIEDKFYSNIDYWLSIPSRMPLDIKRGIYISSYYGYREDPLHKKNQFHSGDDFSADTGTPVKSTAEGVVLKAEYNHRLGNFVEIDHGYGYKTLYGHMVDGLSVKKGDKVTRGQTLGGVGSTGRSTAAHLHYEVKYDNKTENPRKFYTYDKKLEKLLHFP